MIIAFKPKELDLLIETNKRIFLKIYWQVERMSSLHGQKNCLIT